MLEDYRKVWVIGDLHGNYKGLMQVIEKSGFNPQTDMLISLGDIFDGWGDDVLCAKYLYDLPFKILVKGNHDQMVEEFLRSDRPNKLCKRTHDALEEASSFVLDDFYDLPTWLIGFFNRQQLYSRFEFDGKKYLFVHAGINRHYKLENQPHSHNNIFLWDRDFWLTVVAYDRCFQSEYPFKMRESFDHIFIGHTPTIFLNGNTHPETALKNKVINMDTGAGFATGRVSIMNVLDFNEFYVSDTSQELYPDLEPLKKI